MPREITLEITFDQELSEEAAAHAVDVFAGQVRDLMLEKDRYGVGWGYGRALVVDVQPAPAGGQDEEPTVFVVSYGHDESPAVFARQEDADEFAAIVVAVPERLLVCGPELAARMIAEARDQDDDDIRSDLERAA